MRLPFVVVLLTAWNCGGRASLIDGDGPLDGPDAARPAPLRPDSGVPPFGVREAGVPPRDGGIHPVVCRDVTGRWAGSWNAASGVAGTWQTDLVETASGALSGNSAVTGTQCGTTSTVTGKRDVCAITIGLSSFGGCTVVFTGTLQGDAMSGTFTVAAGLSDHGEWSGSRVR